MRQVFKIIIYTSVILALVYFFLNISFFIKQVNFTVLNPDLEKKRSLSFNGDADPNAAPILQKNEIVIPRLDLVAPIVESEGVSEADFQKALIHGVVHYPGTSLAGQVGNAYYFGHSSDYPWSVGKYKTVFALLPRIEIGEDIYISNDSGNQYHYLVTSKFVVNNNDRSVIDQNGITEKQLTLQTSYPLGTALKRYIVRAKLVE